MGNAEAPETGIASSAYWTVAQLAQLLAVKGSTLRTWMRRGQSPPYLKIGRTVRFDRSTVAQWLEGKTVAAARRPAPHATHVNPARAREGFRSHTTQAVVRETETSR